MPQEPSEDWYGSNQGMLSFFGDLATHESRWRTPSQRRELAFAVPRRLFADLSP
jgi:hypothetical protein